LVLVFSMAKRKGRRKNVGSQLASLAMHPPQIATNIRARHVYRFVGTGLTGPVSVTTASLFAAMGLCCQVVNNTSTAIWAAFRIKRVRLWAIPSSTSGNSTAILTWGESATAPGAAVELSDTSISQTLPAFVEGAPPAGSTCSFWQSALEAGTSSTQMFTVAATGIQATSAGGNVIVDVDVEMVLNDGNADLNVAVTAAALGSVRFAPLDGVGGVLIPQALSLAA
jgi:hypothetical protein